MAALPIPIGSTREVPPSTVATRLVVWTSLEIHSQSTSADRQDRLMAMKMEPVYVTLDPMRRTPMGGLPDEGHLGMCPQMGMTVTSVYHRPLSLCHYQPGRYKITCGDTIYIASGTYSVKTGNEVVLLNKNSTLSGGWNSQFTQRIGKSIIDGNNQRRVITISDQVTTKLLWVDIRNGRVTLHDGGGIYSGYQSKFNFKQFYRCCKYGMEQ